jgi:hypothetical protein
MIDNSSLPPPAAGPPAGRSGLWVTLLAAVGCFVIFLVVLEIAYIPQRRAAPQVDLSKIPPEEQWKYTPEGRKARLDELHAREQVAVTSYAWIDREKGVVRLPLNRAMALTLQELNAGRTAKP